MHSHMKTQFTLAYRCPQCGRIEFRHISIFEFSGKKPLKVQCYLCGCDALVIKTKDYKEFIIKIKCVICNIPHIYYFSLREIFRGKEPIILSCTDYELEVCFLGEKSLVENTVDKYEQDLEEFIDELGYDDYFVNSEIMMECINILHDLAEKDYIYCNCGNNDIGMTLLSDRIELRCQYCRGYYDILARNRKDVEYLMNSQGILLKKASIVHRDSYPLDPNR